jgi:hypothetical protein
MAACFSLRFRSGKWKRMRVIEAAPVEDDAASARAVALEPVAAADER